MKRLALWLATVLVGAAVVHVAGVWALPRVIMAVVLSRMSAPAQVNTMLHPPRPDESARGVVRPSPDLAYSACPIDLSAGPVRVVVPLTRPYTSLALYSSATDNLFVRNDRDAGAADLDFVVVAAGTPAPNGLPPSTTVVESPTNRALALVRRVIENDASFAAIDAARQRGRCAPYQP